jgi:hypothetical protein
MKQFLFFISLLWVGSVQAQITNIAGPTGSGQFGSGVTVLTNGNYVVTDYGYDEGGLTDIGAVYLYNGSTHALISALKGSTANDQVGSGGVTALPNGNYVVSSYRWDNGTVVDAGAVTWCSGTSGVNGVVSSINSLVGSSAGDQVGRDGVTALSNGNYVVTTITWHNGTAFSAGAVTWGSGTIGVKGVVDAANSLVGSTTDDLVGRSGITALSNGNYLVRSEYWNNGTATDAGAVTWGSGTAGVSGVVGASNSLIGSTNEDRVGSYDVTVLSNGNYVVSSYRWDNGATIDVGAVTWGSGTAGVKGVVDATNSLIGSTNDDKVGYVDVLSNGNYVVRSSFWDNGATIDVGAATWCDGAVGRSGAVTSSNSLVGSTAYDRIGYFGDFLALSNGDYVVASPNWANGTVVRAGAVTWCSGTSGVNGPVSSSNSLVGSTADDQVGRSVTALSNGNYVVSSSNWDNGTVVDVGAVTWCSGTSGLNGLVSSSNSLVGSTTDDRVGGGRATALSNGDYVVVSFNWANGNIVRAGAVTLCNGTSGLNGLVSSSNSLVGSTANDQVGIGGVTALSNGNYVVSSPSWANGTVVRAGAVTLCNGTSGLNGLVSSNNSLVGSTAGDEVGYYGSITALSNGNYVVGSGSWDNGTVLNAGAATWVSGTAGVSGVVSASNSLVGSTANDRVGRSVTALSNGNYLVSSSEWANGMATNAGAVTWGSGTAGVNGPVSSSNSLVGSTAYDQVGGYGFIALSNGNYVLSSYSWDNGTLVDAGAVTSGSGTVGVSGTINSCNSVVNSVASGFANFSVAYNNTYDYNIVGKPKENMVSIIKQAIDPALGIHLDTKTQTVGGTATTPFINNDCRIIASVLPNGASPISGSVTAKVWVETTQPTHYLKRHYQITPTTNPTTATGRITLYFTQQEFTDFNTQSPAPTKLLPTGASDATGKANFTIEKRGGVSSDGTGLPSTYSGSIETIDPADSDIVWNATLSRWEITFDVTGFGGFFAKLPCIAPTIYNLTGTGSYCIGSAGIIVGLSSSENGINYQLKNGAVNIATALGTGSTINFGTQRTGTYIVVATRTADGCAINMSGNAVLTASICCPSSATVHVNPTVSSGTGDGSSWANAYASLADALTVAHACTIITTIKVAAGTYKPTQKPYNNGAEMTTNDARDITFQVRDGLTLEGGYDASTGARDITANVTILSGDIGIAGDATDNAYHVLIAPTASSGAIGVTINGFSIIGGNANNATTITINGNTVYRNYGAGAYVFNGINTLSNNTIKDNFGGGIIVCYGTNTLSNSKIFNNSSTNPGAGIYTFFGINTLSNNMVYSNSATSSDGGGIYTYEGTSTLSNNTIYNNSAGKGAGLYTYQSTNTNTNVLSNNTIYSNSAINNGGGIYTSSGTNTLINNTIYNNSLGSLGFGGGIYILSGTNTLTNNTIYSNSVGALGKGGGVYTLSGTNTLTNNTIYSNSVGFFGNGGAIYTQDGTNTLTNNIFWANKKSGDATVGSADYYAAGTNGNTFKNNMLQLESNNYSISNTGNYAIGTAASDNLFAQDPYFVDAATNNLQIGACSPATDAGTNTGAPANDLLSNAIFNTTKDIGAYERQTELCPVYANTGNGCQTLTLNNVTGNQWFYFNNNKGRVAAINPNGQNLGTVTVEVNDANNALTVGAAKFLGRSVNINSTTAPTANYTLRLYYYDTELTEYNTATNGTFALTDFNMTWASGGTSGTGCDLSTYRASATTNGLVAKADVTEAEYGASNNGFSLELSLNHFTAFAATTSGGNPLPVKLLAFTGIKDKNVHLLNWITATEQNASYFEVQYSANGNDFAAIGNVRAAGNSNTPQYYDFTNQPTNQSTHQPICYYRLKMIDFDGSFEYSNVITIKEDGKEVTIIAFPNPSETGIFTLQGKSFARTDAIVTNVLGQAIPTVIQNNQLNLSTLPAGVYFVRIAGENNTISVVKL